MQSKLRQELYRQTKPLMAELFPQSNLLNLENFPSIWRVWELNRDATVIMYVILCPSPKDDSVTFEIAWSTHGTLPEFDGRHPEEGAGRNKMRFRLPQFWQRYGAEHWWYFDNMNGSQEFMIPAPNASLKIKLKNVGPQLEGAFGKLRQYAVPYLKSIAARYNAELQVNA